MSNVRVVFAAILFDCDYKVQVAFYSADRKGHVWPGGGEACNLDDRRFTPSRSPAWVARRSATEAG